VLEAIKTNGKNPKSLFHFVEKVIAQKINPGNLGECWKKAFKNDPQKKKKLPGSDRDPHLSCI